MKISTRLKTLNVVVVLLTLILVIMGHSMSTRISSSMNDSRGLMGSKLLSDGNNAIWELRFGIANYTLSTPEKRKKYSKIAPNIMESSKRA